MGLQAAGDKDSHAQGTMTNEGLLNKESSLLDNAPILKSILKKAVRTVPGKKSNVDCVMANDGSHKSDTSVMAGNGSNLNATGSSGATTTGASRDSTLKPVSTPKEGFEDPVFGTYFNSHTKDASNVGMGFFPTFSTNSVDVNVEYPSLPTGDESSQEQTAAKDATSGSNAMVQSVDINPPPKSYVGVTTDNNAANTKTKANSAGNTSNGFPVGKNMYYRPKATTTPSQAAQGEASTSSGPPSKKVDAASSSSNLTSNKNNTPAHNGNDKTSHNNSTIQAANVSTSNPFDSLSIDEGVQEGGNLDEEEVVNAFDESEGFLDTVTSGWNQNVNGCSMFRVVKCLKGLKSSFRKLLHNQGNLHERVNSLRKELDEVQKAIDIDPFNSALREDHAHYLLARFSVAYAWESLRTRADVVEWFHIPWFSHCIPRHAIHLWLVIRHKLKTQDILRESDVGPDVDLSLISCPLCETVPDSHPHLFFECPFSMQVWFQVRGLSGMDSVPPLLGDVITFLVPISKGRLVASIISRLLPAATTYYIWLERNARLFKRKKSTVAEVVQVIVSNVRLKLVTFKFKKLTARSRSMLDAWKIPSVCLESGGIASSGSLSTIHSTNALILACLLTLVVP
ncbi:reverse transcriptase zinc-binding domain-containing protein [Artemisia annua]|uniref:Reverse transcriptase zinc-binding domain-containing protein n=1 Tax=Artemisia annua TaxID=35608 RepID=A0A2U1Q4P2_ARTAN|nr:reverse transcriptase zinc-binding domain-containing protein [Artemisia annua]